MNPLIPGRVFYFNGNLSRLSTGAIVKGGCLFGIAHGLLFPAMPGTNGISGFICAIHFKNLRLFSYHCTFI
jgi:hypothetical protein